MRRLPRLVLLVGFAVAIGCGRKPADGEAPPENTGPAPTANPQTVTDRSLMLSAADLLAEYRKDEALTEERLLGKILHVRFDDATLMRDATGTACVVLGTDRTRQPGAVARLANEIGWTDGETPGDVFVEGRLQGLRRLDDFAWARPWQGKGPPAPGIPGRLVVLSDAKIVLRK